MMNMMLRVNSERLLARIDTLGRVGATGDGGVSRRAFSSEDVLGRQLVTEYMTAAGLSVEVDAAGNLIGRLAGSHDGPMLLLGSHIDTVPNGGRLDGAYGVLAAIEALHTLTESGHELPVPVGVVAFTNEEGTSGIPGMWGSLAFIGALGPEDLSASDENGTPVSHLLAAVGGDVDRVPAAAWRGEDIAAYLELHIEQGPVLEHHGTEIGVVEAITGRLTAEIVVTGQANHAGTTPMDLRRDALVAAAHMILAVRAVGGPGGPVRVATVGQCGVSPNAWNVVPGTARLRVDLRDVSSAAMLAGLRQLEHTAGEVGERTGTSITVTRQQLVEPVACDPVLQSMITEVAGRIGLSHAALPSGAGHDAQIIGRIAPVGMIFVPSHRGISHAPGESTAPAQLVSGANVLLQTVLAFASRSAGVGAAGVVRR